MMSPAQFKLQAHCPKCGAPVRLRNRPLAIDLMRLAIERGEDPDTVIQTYQCHRKVAKYSTCNNIIEIRLRDWRPMEFG